MNKPVAWMDEETGCFVYSQYDYEDLDEHGKDGLIPLYTHPVKELTDENYKEALACLQFALHDTLDYIKLNNLGGENNHWIVWAKAILRKAQEK